jgi:hypothetical protein
MAASVDKTCKAMSLSEARIQLRYIFICSRPYCEKMFLILLAYALVSTESAPLAKEVMLFPSAR